MDEHHLGLRQAEVGWKWLCGGAHLTNITMRLRQVEIG